MPRCPKCSNEDIREERITLGEGRAVREFYCHSCHLLEDALQGTPAFEELARRWSLHAPSGPKLRRHRAGKPRG